MGSGQPGGNPNWEKGKSQHPEGRTKGSKNKKTIQWLKLQDFILDEGAQIFMQNLRDCGPEEFGDRYLAILNYFKPRMSTSRVITETPPPIQLIDARTYVIQNGRTNGADSNGATDIDPVQPDLLGE